MKTWLSTLCKKQGKKRSFSSEIKALEVLRKKEQNGPFSAPMPLEFPRKFVSQFMHVDTNVTHSCATITLVFLPFWHFQEFLSIPLNGEENSEFRVKIQIKWETSLKESYPKVFWKGLWSWKPFWYGKSQELKCMLRTCALRSTRP